MPATHRRDQEETTLHLPMAQGSRRSTRAFFFLRKMDVILSAVPDEERSRSTKQRASCGYRSLCASDRSADTPLRARRRGESNARSTSSPRSCVTRACPRLGAANPVAFSSPCSSCPAGPPRRRGSTSIASARRSSPARARPFARPRVPRERPVTSLARLAMRDVGWVPEAIEGRRTGSSSRRDRAAGVSTALVRVDGRAPEGPPHATSCSFSDAESLMELASRPWEGLWLSLSVRRELSFAS
jgi:hypothetical protein